ncbi:hypothetical protein [Spartinivicinus poritis]|uniref:DNA maturase A n=1 Tax=Spartinivicinus poritis TaxID=2994640 RepID=A0ABT5U6V9_9GAMM|nr:hypothetical protein [Spartinivicinus sp. A2-2]MDE1462100.1 hypothetical protein [Spartinivicinus sp. A2-2]
MTKTLDQILSQLHSELAQHLLDKLTTEKEGEAPSASELNVIRQFLKDNHISDIPRPDSPLAELENKLNEVDPFDPDDIRYTH